MEWSAVMNHVTWLVTAVSAGAGLVIAAFGVYLLVLSVAAFFYRPSTGAARPTTNVLVVVPAHNEATLLARCLASLLTQTYPRHLYRVVVVADNCTDATAQVASYAGAHLVLERDEPSERGKGYALRWAIERLLAAETAADAIVVVDADSIADPRFLTNMVAPVEGGAQAVQGESLLYGNGSPGTALRLAAFLLVNRVRPAGRAALGLPTTHLAGNGMLLARELLLAKPWSAFSSAEDLEYSLHLQADRVPIRFAGGAILTSPAAPNPRAAAQQQLRWEGGKIHLARTWLPRLARRAVRERRADLLGVAFDLAVPPLGLLAAAALSGSGGAAVLSMTGVTPAWSVTPWLIGLVVIPVFVVVGLRAGRAPRAAYAALVRAPAFVLAKPLRARRALRFRGDTWVRTERASVRELGGDS
jgi:1,2-diacylglycerol 3-beta-glucosyltransferase